MIVCGVADNTLRERLLRDGDLTLEKAIAAGHAAEETKRHAQELKEHQESADVHKVNCSKDNQNVLHMVKDAISATAKTILKPVVLSLPLVCYTGNEWC